MRTRPLLLGGFAAVLLLGLVATYLLAPSVADALDGSGRATTSATCDGAAIDLTVGTLPDSESVFAQVIVNDDRRRSWEVRWPLGGELPPTLQGSDLGGVVRHGFQVVGDLDDGTERDVRLRPQGATDWCRVSADFS